VPPTIAAVVFFFGIIGLFLLSRDRDVVVSNALWIPVIWLLIAGSRMVSQWLQPQTINTPDQYLEGSPIDRVILTGLLLIGILVLLRRVGEVESVLRANVPILVYFSYCAMSIIWSDFPDVAFKRWTKALGDLVMVLIVLTDRYPAVALKRLLVRCGFLLLPLSVLLCKYYPELGRGYTSTEYGSWIPVFTGVTTDKNMLGMVCLVFGLGSTWLFCEALRERPRKTGTLVSHAIVLAMVLWLLHVAHSSTSFACFLFGSALIMAMTLFGLGQSSRAHVIVWAIASIVVLMLVFPETYADLIRSQGKNMTLTGRTDLWNELLNMVSNKWFGTGFESFWLGTRLESLWRIHWWHPQEAHNGYIEIYLNLGWAGVLLLAVLMIAGYRNVLAGLRNGSVMGSFKFALFMVAAIYNLTEAAFKTLHPLWLFFILTITAIPESVESRARLDAHRKSRFTENDEAPVLAGYGAARSTGYPLGEVRGELKTT
jgi:O-antigen ligase